MCTVCDENMFCHAKVLIANDIKSTRTYVVESTTRTVELHQTLFADQ